ncbi:DNA damage-regulated autophagy modulator protein 2 [Tribolium castaneum]|uniref:DNA damage-regulated autophagy modulator protein 2-like Protein n=1 Tax=Tribolium castaneum TaxID=7070 RepID=D6W8K3_TRICA|nr:PREDICTED: DNA damage-regulated autophagy modulator protein 2 [Tribolium castaneum]EEZ98295.1 DNA damage-regulated autophagy modulator protein 2-like Protein [Tribolium castaneum]|eukprot:XP_008201358.1 PREDICTED: DNA damage-regulated autophagy modulator protein 2 [Tribolium castaneum]
MEMRFRLHYWPILTGFWFYLTFITSYLVAIYNDHVVKLFPYISDTGTVAPDSCIFGQMLNLGAAFMLITMYVRYRTLQLIPQRRYLKAFKPLNSWSNLFGSLSCLGISLVANFQEKSEITVHFIGAFMAFGVGAVYCIIHAYLTWFSYSSGFLKFLRIFLSLLVILLYVLTSVFSSLSFNKFDGKDALKWSDNHAGYGLHLVATFSEWVMAIVMGAFVATYYVEFKQVRFKEIVFTLDE